MNLNNEGHSHGAASSPEEVIKAELRTEHCLIKMRTGRQSFQKTVSISLPGFLMKFPFAAVLQCVVVNGGWGAGEARPVFSGTK